MLFNWSNQSIPIKKSTRIDLDNGFWLNFYFNSPKDDNVLMNCIHNHTQILSTISKKGHYIQSGSYNFFHVKRIFNQKLELTYNDCIKKFIQ